MNRRDFLKLSGTVAASAFASTALFAAEKKTTKKPNIIFFFTDDLGWGDLGCYGNEYIKTPNIDKFASQGTRYTQFYVNSPVCAPSRVGFMTGLYPARVGLHHIIMPATQGKIYGVPTHLDPAAPLITRQLKENGYATGHFGKWHLGIANDDPHPDKYFIDEYRVLGGPPGCPTWQGQDDRDVNFKNQATGLIVDEAIKFIDKHKDEPFYLNLWTIMPHAPHNPTQEQLDKYENLALKWGKSEYPYPPARQIYYAAITDIDDQFGRLMDKLDEMGVADNTIVVFSSDNGPEDMLIDRMGIGSTGPFRGRKRSIYEGGVRMPFILRWPDNTPQNKIDETSVISGIDWLPTMCAVTGAKLPTGQKLDGEDISDIFKGASRPRKSPLCWQWRSRVYGHVLNQSPQLAIREGKWKLLINPDMSRVELYDIPNDPTEMTNLADKNKDIVAKMSKQVIAWSKELPDGPIQPEAGKIIAPWPKIEEGAKDKANDKPKGKRKKG